MTKAAIETPSTGDLAFRLSLDAIIVMDATGSVTGWNPAAEKLFGWTAEEAVGRKVADLVVPAQYQAPHDAGLKRFRETGKGPVLGKVLDILTAVKRDGTEFPLEIRISHASGSGEDSMFVAFLRDISSRKWAERNQQTRYAVTRAIASRSSWTEVLNLVLESTCEQLGFLVAEAWVVDDGARQLRWETSWSQPGRDVRAFTAASMESGISPGEGLLGKVFAERMGSRSDLRNEPEARSRAAAACGLGYALVVPILGGDTALGVVALYRLARNDEVDAVAMEVLADVGIQLGQHLERVRVEAALRQAQQRMRDELEVQANSDRLTGLMNRAGFDEVVRLAVANGRRQSDEFALLMLDLDGFKAVNDTHGHQAGDRLLIEVGRRLNEILRVTDTVARLGGDEFAVLTASGIDIDGARRLAAKVMATFDAPTDVGGVEVSVVPSVGIALFPAHGMDAASLLANADAAMYLAKRNKSGHAMYREGLPAGRGASMPMLVETAGDSED
ncbi:MAG: diguanylate cyclase domain-containing protein [Candidatus Dormibacteria bacterium]